jgi:hypothetical protein
VTPPGRDALAARVLAWQSGSLQGAPPEPWEALLLDVHRWQRAHAPVLAALAPTPAATWLDVPAAPIGLYKDLAVGTVPPGSERAVFRTSGTTGGGRGVHRLWSTDTYDHGARLWANACVPGAPRRVVGLLVDPAEAPDASLSHMVADFARPGGTVTWCLRDGRPDRPAVAAALAGPAPVYLCATAFALADWLAPGHGDVTPLPPDSVVMVTGGFKGHAVALDDAQLYDAIRARLRPARLVTEYGMTELCSQLWGEPAEPYRPPPWLRALAVDPVSGAPRAPGEPGQLRFYDLANLDASVGVETLDEGVVHEDGRVSLRGRLAGAEARGCSLTVEEAWARST